MNLSFTGQVAYIDYSNPGAPPAGAPIAVGDTFTLNYSVDVNQVGRPTTSNIVSGGKTLNSVLAYKTGPGTLSFSSGLSILSNPLTLKPHSFTANPSAPQAFQQYMTLLTQSAPLSETNGVTIFSTANYQSNGAPYSSVLSKLLGLANATPTSSFIDLALRPAALGLADSDCLQSRNGPVCSIFTSNVTSSVSVTPVPLPAPFLMLGLSILGLVSARRLRRS